MSPTTTETSGSVVFEFLLAVLVFCFLGVVAAEIGFALQVRQIMATIAREASVTAFKQCSRNADRNGLNTCLASIVTPLNQVLASTLKCVQYSPTAPKSGIAPFCPEVIISIYDLPSGATVPTVLSNPGYGTFTDTTHATIGGYKSYFSTTDPRFKAAPPGTLFPMLQINGRIVIGEVFWTYHPWIPAFGGFSRFSLGGIYDANIV